MCQNMKHVGSTTTFCFIWDQIKKTSKLENTENWMIAHECKFKVRMLITQKVGESGETWDAGDLGHLLVCLTYWTKIAYTKMNACPDRHSIRKRNFVDILWSTRKLCRKVFFSWFFRDFQGSNFFYFCLFIPHILDILMFQ